MNKTIHYQVEAKFWRREVPKIHQHYSDEMPTKEDLAESNTVFKNTSPLLAREAAFNHYFSIIDVLYSGLNKEQTTDAQARIDLQQYFDSGNAIELGGKDKRFKISPDMDKGIEIYMLLENPKTKSVEKFSIHGIRYLEYLDRFDATLHESLDGLIEEYNYYKENNYLVNKYVENLDLEAVGGEKVSVIKTPFSWAKLIQDFNGLNLFEEW